MFLSIGRSNYVTNQVLSADAAAGIAASFTHNIVEDSVLCSDGSWSYVAIAKEKNVSINDWPMTKLG